MRGKRTLSGTRNEENIMLRDRMTTSITALAAGAFVACACLANPADLIEARSAALSDERAELINQRMGLAASTVLELNIAADDPHQVLPLIVHGVPVFIELEPHSVRSEKYQVMIDIGNGRLVEAPAGPERTVRGNVLGIDGATVAGSMMDDGLHLRIALPWGTELWLEPIADRVEGAAANEYVLYDSLDVLENDRSCGVHLLPDALAHRMLVPDAQPGGTPINSGVKVAELAVDADYEYYTYWGSSVSNVVARIESVINTVNGQYEPQVGIRHEITTIIVRTSSNQPYTHTRADRLLNQFRSHWNANHSNIVRDIAHLFTGKNLNGGTIGIAWVGVVCHDSYGYALSQVEFNGNYASACDLVAHELGHNWNAQHCSCPNHTMSASITSANTFHPTATIPVITQFRDSRTCLHDGSATPGYGACCLAGCFQTDEASCIDLGGTFAGVGTACGDSPCGCPSGQVPDCNGNCAPASWIGDGICDDGSYTFNGVPIYFNCEEFDCDGGDCVCDDDPDPTPPAAPTGLSANAGDGVVSLNWNDNSESDLAGYNVYRSTSSNGTYSKINGSLVTSSSYNDTNVNNGTTYWYRVTAVNDEGLESANSNTVSATPSAPGADPTTMSVSAISLTTVNVGQGNRIGRSQVTVVDNNGNPVQGAAVTGNFTGDYNETRSGVTNAQGVATIDTVATARGNINFTFCVTNITHGSLDYAPGGNNVTCASN
jgi:hypothetical protein